MLMLSADIGRFVLLQTGKTYLSILVVNIYHNEQLITESKRLGAGQANCITPGESLKCFLPLLLDRSLTKIKY